MRAAAGDGAGNFNGGDVGDVDDRGGVLARDAAHPYGSGFQDVALDQGAGIDEVGGGHLSAARGGWFPTAAPL